MQVSKRIALTPLGRVSKDSGLQAPIAGAAESQFRNDPLNGEEGPSNYFQVNGIMTGLTIISNNDIIISLMLISYF